MHRQMLRTLLLSIGILGVASAASEAGRGKPPGSTATSTDSDAGSASSDPETDSPQSDGDPTPPAKDKRRDHRDKHHPRRTPDVTGPLRARVEQADRALQKLLSAKAQALQLLHGAPPHRDHGTAASSAKTADPATGGPDSRDSSDDAPAADP